MVHQKEETLGIELQKLVRFEKHRKADKISENEVEKKEETRAKMLASQAW